MCLSSWADEPNWRQKPVEPWTSDLPPSDAIGPRSATTNPCHRPHIVPASQMRSHHDQRATAHHGILASCPLRRPRCQPVLPRPQRATTSAGAGEQHRPGRKPTRQLPNQPRAFQHQLEHIPMLVGMRQVVLCAIHAAARTDELRNAEPTLVQPSSADEPTASNRRQRMTSTHATALGADQCHRERAVLAPGLGLSTV